MSLERILVLVDFSAGSRVALERATQIASQSGASLHLLHAIGLHGTTPEAAVSEIEQAALDRIRQLAQQVRDQGVDAAARTHAGSVLEAFEWLEDEVRPDLVVVGARGATRLRRLLLGGTAHSIVQHAFAPVLVARGTLGVQAEPFQRILVATDFSADPACSAAIATAVAAADASVHVTHVIQSPPQAISALGPTVLKQQHDDAKAHLDRVAQELQATPHLLEGHAPRSVIELADKLHCDVIAIGTRGAESASWFASASVAGEILRRAGASVITARCLRERPEIRDELEDLHSELAGAEDLGPAQRATVTELVRNLRRLVDESQELRHGMLAEFGRELDQLAEDLRVVHPKLSTAIRTLRRALAQIGL